MRWRCLLRDGTDSPEEVADFVGSRHENRVWYRFISQRIEHDQVHTDCNAGGVLLSHHLVSNFSVNVPVLSIFVRISKSSFAGT